VPEDPPPAHWLLAAQAEYVALVWPQNLSRERLNDLILQGESLVREVNSVAACGYWLEAWAMIRQLARPEHRSAEALARAYGLLYEVDSWSVELVWELGNAGIDDPAYYERQLQFSREYLERFPDSEPETVVNMLRAQGEALWRMGRRPEAEATYAALVERLPDEGWGYIGWSDQYWLMHQKDASPEYELGESILKLALIRPSLCDREDVLERLAELYGEWDKPDEQARTAAELAKLRQAQAGHGAAPVVRVPAPASKGKPGRNEPCWCGSGRKYKHCHLYADQAR
jgi:tetratricopeptide (TPR) repeat protein